MICLKKYLKDNSGFLHKMFSCSFPSTYRWNLNNCKRDNKEHASIVIVSNKKNAKGSTKCQLKETHTWVTLKTSKQ